MTLEEAILHCRKKAKELSDKAYEDGNLTEEEAYACNECAFEHEQLARWLEELKQRREKDITKEPERQPSNNYSYTKEEKRRAWLDKYILGIASPSAVANGFKYRWDMIKAHEEEAKHGGK